MALVFSGELPVPGAIEPAHQPVLNGPHQVHSQVEAKNYQNCISGAQLSTGDLNGSSM